MENYELLEKKRLLCVRDYSEGGKQLWTAGRTYFATISKVDGEVLITDDNDRTIGFDDVDKYFNDVTKEVTMYDIVRKAYVDGYITITDKTEDGVYGIHAHFGNGKPLYFGHKGGYELDNAGLYLARTDEKEICKQIATALSAVTTDKILNSEYHNILVDMKEKVCNSDFLKSAMEVQIGLSDLYNDNVEDYLKASYIDMILHQYLQHIFDTNGTVLPKDFDIETLKKKEPYFIEQPSNGYFDYVYQYDLSADEINRLFGGIYDKAQSFEGYHLNGADVNFYLDPDDQPMIWIHFDYEEFPNEDRYIGTVDNDVPINEEQFWYLKNYLEDYRDTVWEKQQLEKETEDRDI